MPDQDDYSGRAALTICESLLLAMNDHNILTEHQIVGVLVDSAASHEQAAVPGSEGDRDRAVAKLIKRIINSGNSVRRP